MTTLRQPYSELSPEIYKGLGSGQHSAGKKRIGQHDGGAGLFASVAN